MKTIHPLAFALAATLVSSVAIAASAPSTAPSAPSASVAPAASAQPAVPGGPLTPATTTIFGMQENRPWRPEASQAAIVEQLAVALLVSCDLEMTSRLPVAERWQQAFECPHVRVVFVFTQPRTFTFRFSPSATPDVPAAVIADEIFVPISREKSPDYIWVRHRGQVRAFTKYHDGAALAALKELLPAALKLRKGPPMSGR